MNFWDKIKDELEYQGISQKELAAKADINIQTLRNSISVNRLPDLESAYKIATVLNQPLEYFLNGDIFPPNNYHLPTNEIELLTNFRKLTDDHKKVISHFIADMAKIDNVDISMN